MIEQQLGSLRLLSFESLAGEPGLIHAVTTRPLNMAPHRGLGREEAIRWRRALCDVLGLAFDRLTSPEQVMGADVLTLADCDVGSGRDGRAGAVKFVDGLITDRMKVPLLLLSADCPLICAYDPVRHVVGAVHAGWQGTLADGTGQLVRRMSAEHGCRPAHLKAAIAPSAGPMSYEVGEEVLRVARTRRNDADELIQVREGRLTFDLWETNRRQLLEFGVPADHIEVAGLDTITDERFWSHRRDGKDAGRFALIVALV
jgi:hypothetical protein